jgi:hypothetical protein
MKTYKLKCKLQYNLLTLINNDERPELDKSYTVIDVKKVEIKNTNNSFFAFKLKEFENNEVIQWFSEGYFDVSKNKIVENFTEII